jgi:hypothetical protein
MPNGRIIPSPCFLSKAHLKPLPLLLVLLLPCPLYYRVCGVGCTTRHHVIVCCGIGLSAASGVGDVVLPLLSDVGVGDIAIVVAEESKINKVSLPVKKQ